MKKCSVIISTLLLINSISTYIYGQNNLSRIDSLKKALLTSKEDIGKVSTLNELASQLADINSDSALAVFNSAHTLATKLNDNPGIADGKTGISKLFYSAGRYNDGAELANEAITICNNLLSISDVSKRKQILTKLADAYNALQKNVFPQGNYPAALKIILQELKLREELKDKKGISYCEFNLGNMYLLQHNYPEALKHVSICLRISQQIDNKSVIAFSYNAIGLVYFELGNYEQALKNYLEALKFAKESKDSLTVAEVYVNIGLLKEKQHSYGEALEYDFATLKIYEGIGDNYNIPFVSNNIAMVYLKQKKYNNTAEYLSKALSVAKKTSHLEHIKLTYENLAQLDSIRGDYKKAWQDYKLAIIYRDSLLNKENTQKIIQQQMQYDFDKKEAVAKTEQDKKDAEAKRIKNLQYFIIGGLGIVMLAVVFIAFIQWRYNKQKKKANLLLQQQKEKVEITLSELKSTQAQLIQSEKMASLGELTAGIAHEIQNPLNFVNNFSEVNRELIEELKEEAKSGHNNEVIAIADDISVNEEKINHHGKRADAIVKGMLQHSRSSTGVREPTDINALADEYLRLAYHGLRAKDKEFNAVMKTDFDESIGNINIIPQDIGRVLLNLYNNAFYAVNEKKKQQPENYEPTVSVATKKKDHTIELTVKDSGNGIPKKVVDKIFQPFFTTKPTGVGTGLGLSLSYDIIKAHGGEIMVNTIEGEFTEFVIQLPVSV